MKFKIFSIPSKSTLLLIEISIFVMLAILSIFWILNPNGTYEPTIVFLTALIFLVEIIRRNTTETIVSNTQDKTKIFDSEFWPEEGIPEFRSVTTHLTFHTHPEHESKISAELEVKKGSIIEYTSFRYRTIRSGKIVAKSEGTLRGRNLGEIIFLSTENYYDSYEDSTEIAYNLGDTFEYLQYRAEGSCLLRVNECIYDIHNCPWLGGSDEIALTKDPLAESWLNTTSGWLFVESGVVEEFNRIF